MNNQVAINFLDQVRKILLDDKSWLESTEQPINEVFDMAISALREQDLQPTCNQLATDTISKQAVIDLYKQYQPYMAVKVIEFGKALEQLPSAQPEPCEVAEKCRRKENIEQNDYMDLKDNASEAEQLADWLNELKLLRDRIEIQHELCEDAVSRADVEIAIANILRGVFVEYQDIAKKTASKLPPVTPKRKTGKWKKIGHWGRCYRCDQCGNILDFDGVNAGRGDANFCPNCGADMNGGE